MPFHEGEIRSAPGRERTIALRTAGHGGANMQVALADIPATGLTVEAEETADVLDIDKEEGAAVRSPVRCRLRLRRAGPSLVATGELAVRVQFWCSRCGEAFEMEVREPSFSCAHEVPDTAEFVDLTGDIRESILLTFPAHPVCSETCKGLCSQCGANLNRESCDCRPPTDLRWSALDNL